MPLVCHPHHLYVTHMYSYVICMSLVWHPYVTSINSYAIRMSVVCTPLSSVYHSCMLVCHPYVIRMYSYFIFMSLVCTRMSLVCTHMSLVCIFTTNCQQLNRYVFSKVMECLEQNIKKKLIPEDYRILKK